MFFVDHDITDSANLLNSDPSEINEWALQWKISFNTDPTKQAPEIIFSHKHSKRTYTDLLLSSGIVDLTTIHKHSEKLRKISITIDLLRRFQGFLPRTCLLIIYKSSARPHLEYGEIIHDQTFNEFFHQRIESVECNAAIAITGAIKCTSAESLYRELGLDESLRSKRWLRKLCLFYKIYRNKSPSHL